MIEKLGANLTSAGATFRTWAPTARRVTLRGSFSDWNDIELHRDGNGYWSAFVPDVEDGDEYKFHVEGTGSSGFKRDSHARSIDRHGDRNCSVTDPITFPWHDSGWKTPPYEHFIIYQLHVGAFFATNDAGEDVRTLRVGKIPRRDRESRIPC